jgi:hypothetical protein
VNITAAPPQKGQTQMARPMTQTQQRMSRIAQVFLFDAGALTGIALLLRLESPGPLQSATYPLLGGCLGYIAAAIARIWFDRHR